MTLFNSTGLVLRRERHLESDVRLTLFLRDIGKVRITSRSGQKLDSRYRSLQEPFTEADFQVYLADHSVNGRLIGGTLKNSHPDLRTNMAAFGYGAQCCEVIDALIPYRVPTTDVFDILLWSLRSLQITTKHQQVWIQFVSHLLKILGHGDFSGQSDSVVERELELILPWRLKSTVLT